MEHPHHFAEPHRLADLGLAPDLHARLRTSLLNYQRHARLIIRLEASRFPHARFTATQATPAVNGRVLTATEIHERVAAVLEPLHALGWTCAVDVR
jgi:hypothetical protein